MRAFYENYEGHRANGLIMLTPNVLAVRPSIAICILNIDAAMEIGSN